MIHIRSISTRSLHIYLILDQVTQLAFVYNPNRLYHSLSLGSLIFVVLIVYVVAVLYKYILLSCFSFSGLMKNFKNWHLWLHTIVHTCTHSDDEGDLSQDWHWNEELCSEVCGNRLLKFTNKRYFLNGITNFSDVLCIRFEKLRIIPLLIMNQASEHRLNELISHAAEKEYPPLFHDVNCSECIDNNNASVCVSQFSWCLQSEARRMNVRKAVRELDKYSVRPWWEKTKEEKYADEDTR